MAATGVALLVLALLTLAVATGWAPLARLDRSLSLAAYAGDDRSHLHSVVLEVLTAPGLTAIRALVLLPVVVWLLLRAARVAALWVAVAGTLVGPLTAVGKEAVGRVRPDFLRGGDRYDSFSFPSGHSSGIATLVVVVLVLAWPRLSPAARRPALAAGVALAVLVAATRMWLGVHYLSDVVAGLALGTAWALLTAAVAGTLPGGRTPLPGGPAPRAGGPAPLPGGRAR
ncbi:phosphatase PAP2 family protein [Modestobacter sp. I12A-02628]|uniref:Phosphatase PAP2 family protein n=1 Tax=Goekera deserti TaxID=2497753 RepID=A0A7K3WC74_9ACTN|nr:phosphatase PAP2 family protein [Goekera deserti]NDI47851.1 phosphatase PAP2 family protein [Goekera deserti]NEL53599.1 phosphatase PAP2 family protein [Goekera deserti]